MGNSNSDGETTVDDCESLARPMPEMTAVSRRIFNLHLKNRSFSSWEEFIEALPSTAPQGASQSIVKCDPMDICSWVATFLIESCIWGLVAYFADQSAAIGIVLSALYGLVLFLCVDRWLSPQMAGMLWPNIPVAVGAVGALVATYLPDNDESKLPSRALIFCILPATLATIYWMRRLPEDPDRSTLVSNLFLGLWAATIALRAMLVDDDSLKDLGYFDFASLVAPRSRSSESIVVLGAISVGVAVWFFERPGRWGSVELVTWSLNIGVLGMGAGASGMLATFAIAHPGMELTGWAPYAMVHCLIGALGFKLQRSFPVLLSALAFAAVCVRLSVWISDFSGSPVAGICCFGVLGFAVIAATQHLRPSATAAGRQLLG
ncbi:unnamed protein product [Durusdinium trenchii]|uniref:Uncharacterized protein n=1 Tax=Durusdinium trenchii TaxID=1381693 RepID=A0ABP0P063_9DINO